MIKHFDKSIGVKIDTVLTISIMLTKYALLYAKRRGIWQRVRRLFSIKYNKINI